MADAEMYDYLSTITPDYTATTLSVSPQKVLEFPGKKAQKAFVMGDGSIAPMTRSNQSYFTVKLIWNLISVANHGTIFDFYHHTSKANGIQNSFYWLHPTDGHTYVARFLGELPSSYNNNSDSAMKVEPVTLFVFGRKAD